MTSSEVFTSLFWMVSCSYVIYLGWTLYQIGAQSAARRRHPASSGPQRVDPHRSAVTSDDEKRETGNVRRAGGGI
jgi:hypothetical protein